MFISIYRRFLNCFSRILQFFLPKKNWRHAVRYLNYKPYSKKIDATFVIMCFKLENLGQMKQSNVKKNFGKAYLEPLRRLCNNFEKVVVFCDDTTYQFLEENNLTKKVYAINLHSYKNIQDMKLASKYQKFIEEAIAKHPKYKKEYSVYSLNLNYPDVQAIYTALLLAKMHFIDRVIKENPFNTNYFFWIDCGCLRRAYTTFWKDWYGKISLTTKKFKICMNPVAKNLKNISDLDISFMPFKTIECYGPIFCVHKENWEKIYSVYNDTLKRLRLAHVPAIEQATFAIMYRDNPELFYPIKSRMYSHVMKFVFEK